MPARLSRATQLAHHRMQSTESERDHIRKTLELALPNHLSSLQEGSIMTTLKPSDAAWESLTISRLAKLNGFRRVYLDPQDFVQLAEGVVVEPENRKKFEQEYRMYARPSTLRESDDEEEEEDSSQTNDATSRLASISWEQLRGTEHVSLPKHPSFREEDFTLYRLLQGSLEDNINEREERMRAFVQIRIDQLRLAYREVAEHINWVTSRFAGGTKDPPAKEKKEVKEDPQEDDSIIEAAQNLTAGALDEVDCTNEDLLVYTNIDGKQLIRLLEDFRPEYRLLALPTEALHVRHGRAATVIYTGLVSFAAVPLAYRSLKYATDYPALAQLLVASVVASVSYSLWSSRHGARTRQLLFASAAVVSRLVAKDDAALMVLQERARLTDAVIDLYLSRLAELAPIGEDTVAHPSDVEVKADPEDIALQLGLLVKDESGEPLAIDWNKLIKLQSHNAPDSKTKPRAVIMRELQQK